MASAVSNQTEKPKNVTIYMNGHVNIPGRKVVLNQKKNKDLDSFCDKVAESIKNPTGKYIQRLATPNTGTRIKSLEQIEDGGSYVAMCDNNFRKLPYTEGGKKKAARPQQQEIKPVQHSSQYREKSAKYARQPIKGKNFKVYANGDDLSHGTPYNLRPRDLSMTKEKLLANLSEVMNKNCFQLCTLDGSVVDKTTEIEHRGQYVVLGPSESFKPLNYGGVSPISSRTTSSNSRGSGRSLAGEKHEPLPPIKKGAGKNGEDKKQKKKEDEDTPEEKETKEEPKKETKKPPQNNKKKSQPPANKKAKPDNDKKDEEKKEEEDVFHAKPVKHKRTPQKEVDYDKDDDGPYKSKQKNEETKGAKEVDDSEETKTDLPVDQRPPEEVEEESEENKDEKNSEAGSDKEEEGEEKKDENQSDTQEEKKEEEEGEEEEEEKEEKSYDEKEEKAAVMIQSGIRGYQARKRVKAMREETSSNKDDAAEQNDDSKKEDETNEEEKENETNEEKKEDEENKEDASMVDDKAADTITDSLRDMKKEEEEKKEEGEKNEEEEKKDKDEEKKEDEDQKSDEKDDSSESKDEEKDKKDEENKEEDKKDEESKEEDKKDKEDSKSTTNSEEPASAADK